MIQYFPKEFSSKAIVSYFLALAAVSFIFRDYIMRPEFMLIGIAWVLIFFLNSSRLSRKWHGYEQKKFVRKLFVIALVIRIVWVLFSWVFYTIKTGIPFEFGASDSLGYHTAAIWYHEIGWDETRDYLQNVPRGDIGYPLYLYFLYGIYGPNIFITRIIKSILSSWMCVLIYKLSQRTFNEDAARMGAVFCCFCPNLIMYCGMHLKETEMIFLAVAALERSDYMMRQKRAGILNVSLVLLLTASLFFFRSVLGSAVAFAIFSSLVFSNSTVITQSNRVLLILWAVIAITFFAGGRIAREAEQLWNSRGGNQAAKRSYQVDKGYEWAKYATGTVMAPMMFVLPFPTMVDVDNQYAQQMNNGGNYVRNFMGIFVILALLNALLGKKNWRNFTLIGAFIVAYLGIVCTSGFANSERFLLPGYPILLMIAAYGITLVDNWNYRYVRMWYWFMPILIISWAVFKLGSRGLL